MDENNIESVIIEDDDPMDIIERQQIFYHFFGYGSHLIYDSYPSKVFVEMKVDLLCPFLDQTNKNRLIDVIWAQRRYRGAKSQLLMSPIFICIVHDKETIKNSRITHPLNIKSKYFSIHPVFRIQKCKGLLAVDKNGQNQCCALFVDEFGRVYQNWMDFWKNHQYADGLMIAPKRGIYNGSTSTDAVLLDVFLCNSGVTKAFDTGSTAIGLASAVVTSIALIPAVTVAPVVLGVALGAGITSAIYTGARSVYHLVDRKKHKQSIGLGNSEARGAWINVGVGVVSAGAAGATQALARAARNGRNISALARNSVRVVNIAAVTVGAGACTDESYSLIYTLFKRKSFSKRHAAQLCINLFLLSHSVNNLQAAKKIMASSNVEAIFCISQKKSFNNLIEKSGKMLGSVAGQPIVRSLKNSIEDPAKLQTILKKVQNAEGTLEDLLKTIASTIGSVLAREYCIEFDKYLNKLVVLLERKLKIGKLNSILRPLINLLREVTFEACNKILKFIEQLINEMAESFKRIKTSINFERFLKMMHIQLKQRSAIEHTDLNSYILAQQNEDLQSIRENFTGPNGNDETFEQIDTIYDEAYRSACDLDENRKIELLIEEYASQYTEELIKSSPATNENELHEIIAQIFRKLSYELATKFFSLVKRLIINARDIQQTLGRFISVDIFIVDIYCLLGRFSCDNNCESLSEFLSEYTEFTFPIIEEEFLSFYATEKDPNVKSMLCPTCLGQVYDRK